MSKKRSAIFLSIIVGLGVVLLLGAQLVPYGHNHSNPPVTQGPQWDSPQTEKLMRGACMDCHSNETVWPWYSNIAPVSWLIQKDVEEGRENLNISEMDQGRVRAEELVKEIQQGRMPPLQYRPMHPEANLNDTQKQQLIDGIIKTFTQN